MNKTKALSFSRARHFFMQKRNFIFLSVAFWAISRAWFVWAATRPENFAWDIDVYRSWLGSLKHFSYPVADETFQYPPLSMLFFAPLFLFGHHYQAGFVGLALFADFLIICIIISVGSRNIPSGWQASLMWVLGGAVFGSLLFQRYDVFPALIAVLALVLVNKRPWLGAAMMGIGFLVKIWPALLLLSFKRKLLPKSALIFTASVVVLWGMIALLFSNSWSFVTNLGGRGLQVESVGALPFLLLQLVGMPVKLVASNGCWEIVGEASIAVALLSTIMGIALLFTLFILRVAGKLENASGTDVALVAVLLFVSTGKVNSPQYMIWVVAIAAVALLNPMTRMRIPAILILISTCLATVIILPAYTNFLLFAPHLVLFQFFRISLLCAATVIGVVAVMKKHGHGSKIEVGITA